MTDTLQRAGVVHASACACLLPPTRLVAATLTRKARPAVGYKRCNCGALTPAGAEKRRREKTDG